ncbi:sugar phosphate isomerase/epimerase family protein [Paenibacillus lupini]|uniref:sugar phosphate isomerase/epimerase family protein n=1 Tax=Paenibacillus lupini TaxID=1450204 RepID=UPI00142489AE|nr:sugar phosphate isomerase/epimerase family protein [Paenibacillus lupini]
MKISLSMWSVHKYWYAGQWSVIDFLEYAATTKAQGVELLSVFWRDRDQELPQILAAAERLGLEIACFCACNNFAVEGTMERAKQLKEVTDAIDSAVALGTRIVRVFSGDLPYDGSMDVATGMKYVKEGLRASAAYAKTKGVILCLENHGVFAGRSDQVMSVITEIGSPHLRSTFDCGNFLLVDQPPNEAVHELIDVIGHVHVKDFKYIEGETTAVVYQSLGGKRYVGTVAGEGDVQLPYLLAQIADHGYPGWLSVEFEGSEEPTEGSMRSVDYVSGLLDRL